MITNNFRTNERTQNGHQLLRKFEAIDKRNEFAYGKRRNFEDMEKRDYGEIY